MWLWLRLILAALGTVMIFLLMGDDPVVSSTTTKTLKTDTSTYSQTTEFEKKYQCTTITITMTPYKQMTVKYELDICPTSTKSNDYPNTTAQAPAPQQKYDCESFIENQPFQTKNICDEMQSFYDLWIASAIITGVVLLLSFMLLPIIPIPERYKKGTTVFLLALCFAALGVLGALVHKSQHDTINIYDGTTVPGWDIDTTNKDYGHGYTFIIVSLSAFSAAAFGCSIELFYLFRGVEQIETEISSSMTPSRSLVF